MLLQVASVRSGVTGRFLRATRPTVGPTPVEDPVSAVTRSGANRADAASSRGTAPTQGGVLRGTGCMQAGALSREPLRRGAMLPRGERVERKPRLPQGRTDRTQVEASSRVNRSDAARQSLNGDRSNAGRRYLKRRTGRTRRDAFSRGLVGRRLRHPQGNRTDAGRRPLPSVVSRCGVGETAGWPQGFAGIGR
jgi:hypothetical protein